MLGYLNMQASENLLKKTFWDLPTPFKENWGLSSPLRIFLASYSVVVRKYKLILILV
jgi:hypothetical protein